MKVLLDENFPLALYRSVLFLTQDEDFLLDKTTVATVVLSRVKQSCGLGERVQIWRKAIRELVSTPRPGRRFELMDDGRVVPWEQTL